MSNNIARHISKDFLLPHCKVGNTSVAATLQHLRCTIKCLSNHNLLVAPATSVRNDRLCHHAAAHPWFLSLRSLSSTSTAAPPKSFGGKNNSDKSRDRQQLAGSVPQLKQHRVSTIVKRLPRRPNVVRHWESYDADMTSVAGNKDSADTSKTAKEAPYGSLTVFATAEEYDVDKLEQWLLTDGIYSRIDLPEELRMHAVHLESRYPVDEEPREIYVFQKGYVAFWNVMPNEIRTLLAAFRQFETSPYDADLIRQESEHMNFMFHQKAVKIDPARGLLCLQDGASHERNDLAKYVFSNATGLSAKLGISESLVEQFTEKIEDIAEKLKAGGKLRLSRRDVMRLSGQMFMFRHKLNLESELATTPDVYWEHEWLETLYAEASRYFSINQRLRVTNDALGYSSEVLDLVRDDLNNSYSHRLEILIIILIMIEVLFECAHFASSYEPKRPDQKHVTSAE